MAYHVGEAKRLKLLHNKALKREAVGKSGCNKEATVSLYFITSTGKSHTIRMTLNQSLAKAKEMVHAAAGIPVKDQRIVLGGNELTNGNQSTLHVLVRVALSEFDVLPVGPGDLPVVADALNSVSTIWTHENWGQFLNSTFTLETLGAIINGVKGGTMNSKSAFILNKIPQYNQITEGQCPENAFEPAQTSEGIPIGIHFNDGPVRCEAPGKGCRGFLEVFYSPATEDFFEDLRPSPQEPLGTTTNATQLARLHRAVMEATKEIFNTKLVAQPQDPPTLLVVGVWDRTGEGYTAPTKVYYSTSPTTPGGPDPLQKACGVPGLSEAEYRNSVLMPLLNHPEILVANNDWVASAIEKMEGDWAQESLLQAERGLKLNGFERPEWLNEEYYNAKVLAFLEPGSPTRQTEVLI
ncbi:unnamed protein product [Polarella glacialis]|uniref:Ubiquitin-like domain-containing protein n=1 Tax=Polarella glacialis TaxID=89957 RepID=A0A813CYK1_POLGL|nr:unnamed protein product [Polarella glacialis]